MKLTIFTPTYNRAYTLYKCYESLKRQSEKNFKWLIIDDGSSDGTEKMVEKWKGEKNDFDILYYYQKNQGMHGAHNTAYSLIDTELNVCIDSDDYMTDDAVEKILKFWQTNKDKKICGFAALNAKENGELIGTRFPKDLKTSKSFELYSKHGVRGDKKFIYRTEITKLYPYPLFKGEKYVGLDYKYKKYDLDYELALMNEVVCIVEYLEDGSSKNMLNQYLKNPKGFSFYRKENMKYPNTGLLYKYKECIHYVASSIICKNKSFLKESPLKILTFLALPAGYIFFLYILKNAGEDNKGAFLWKYFI
ncbi:MULTISPECIES: glycosyltransferase family 2 protein [Psychrilyobacter]|uniref:glycosyltransferase family 2 protein n=1 Tax=Psychrilyobacter TaxID=623282 RepID=UPI0018F5AF91|nr:MULTISPECIES: glycosyltransferase family 2 protein [Psychrilyobacter]MCS5420925.1 glycosyltransferase family 2 protein [Psychrilyobacter sp. S5]